jgi:hypothetical protein
MGIAYLAHISITIVIAKPNPSDDEEGSPPPLKEFRKDIGIAAQKIEILLIGYPVIGKVTFKF